MPNLVFLLCDHAFVLCPSSPLLLFSVFAAPTLSANEEACALSVLGKLLKTRTGEVHGVGKGAPPWLDSFERVKPGQA